MTKAKRPIFNFFANVGEKLLPGNEPQSAMGRVLVIDDESDVRWFVRSALAKAGYEIIEAQDGEEAIQATQGRDFPDIIICDLSIPKHSGMEIVAYLHSKFPSIPLILLTEPSDVRTVRSLSKEEDVNYLVKPIDPESLKNAVDKAVASL